MWHWHATDHHPTTNGAPQVVAVGFAAMVFFMLLLPLARVSYEGTMEPAFLLNLLRSEAGFNIFALLLLLAPIAGVAEAMLAPTTWRGLSALIAGVAVVSIPLALFILSHRVHGFANGTASIAPGVGSYVLAFGYVILTVATGIAAIRARHH